MLSRNINFGILPVKVTSALFALLFLSGCGFTPLYGTSSTGDVVDNQLSAIEIAPAKTRLAQRIRNRLISTLAPPGAQSAALYRLEVFPFVNVRDTLVRGDADVQRKIYNLRVSYKLFDIANNKPLASGTVLAVTCYVRVVSEFANVRARRNAEDRAATSSADDIKIRLAAYFAAR
jgi:LPS-assembly lipoprotein